MMIRMVLAMAAAATSTGVAAQTQYSADVAALDAYQAAKITAPGKTYFIADEGKCLAATPACRTKAYVVAGDVILINDRRGAFVAASFVNARGRLTSGWLPANAVAVTPRNAAATWLGHWRRDSADITIDRGAKPGTLKLGGNATWGEHDPVRRANGAVNFGEFGGEVKPASDHVSYAGQDAGDECKVTLRLIGTYIVAADNLQCGGLNVTFSGIYRR